MVNYEERWQNVHLPNVLKSLPPRIANDLESLPLPEINSEGSYFLYGKVGSGKTTKALQIMITDMMKSYLIANYARCNYCFVTVPELLFQFKRTYNINQFAAVRLEGEDNITIPMTESELVDNYSNLKFLILDDFGVERMTDWSFQLLYIIINRRYDNLLTTIFTSNFSLDELAQRMGDDRLTSRIA